MVTTNIAVDANGGFHLAIHTLYTNESVSLLFPLTTCICLPKKQTNKHQGGRLGDGKQEMMSLSTLY